MASDSLRGVVILDWPGRRRSRSGWMSASESFSRGGQPSTTTPTPPPWDSPHVVMRNKWPNELDMRRHCGKTGARSKFLFCATEQTAEPCLEKISNKLCVAVQYAETII